MGGAEESITRERAEGLECGAMKIRNRSSGSGTPGAGQSSLRDMKTAIIVVILTLD
jgi:hypothetical protein